MMKCTACSGEKNGVPQIRCSRLNIWLCVALNLPECFNVGSMPAYATKEVAFLKCLISPISLKMDAAKIGEIEGNRRCCGGSIR